MPDNHNVPHVLVIGDIAGAEEYHVGDEAMVDANLTRLRAHLPEVRFTLISQDPAYSSMLYAAHAIKPIGFASAAPDSDAQNFARLQQVLHAAELKAADQPLVGIDPSIAAMIEAVDAVNAVLISGGGNMSSTWPQHLFERVALIQIAHILGKPVAVSGQTIGPNLDAAHEALLARVLPMATLLGTRELDSMQRALSLGFSPDKLEYQVDDTVHMASEMPQDSAENFSQPYAVVTLHTFAQPQDEDSALSVLAQQLDRIAEATGLHLVFIPHVGQDHRDTVFSDLRVGRKLASLLKDPSRMTVLGIENARVVNWRTQHASIVISTRYHPLVFGLAGSVPCLGIYTDDYTRIKLQGALEHANLRCWSLPIKAALSDALFEAAIDLWQQHAEISEHINVFQSLWRMLDDQYEKRLLQALQLATANTLNSPALSQDIQAATLIDCDPKGSWRSIVDTLTR